jgi:cephalosporin hydroxylase
MREVEARGVAEQAIIDCFHRLYYDGRKGEGRIFENTHYCGVPVLKNPLDLWTYQEILWEIKPDLIIEAGTYKGGSALYLAHVLDAVGKGQIITIDIEERERPLHSRITYLTGSSTDMRLLQSARAYFPPDETRMVILDSDHSKEHVLTEMRLLAPYVTIGSYLVVEDTNINGHPVLPSFGPGPAEAVRTFLRESPDFAPDRSRERHLLTFNPGGYLKRAV